MAQKNRTGNSGARSDLTAEQRELVRVYREVRSYSEAYRRVCPQQANGGSSQPLNIRAAQKFTNRVRREIERLDAEERDAVRKAAEEDARKVAHLWTRYDSVDTLASLAKKCRDALQLHGRDGVIDPQIARVLTDAVDKLNRMLGYNEPDKSAVDTTVSVVFADEVSDLLEGSADGSVDGSVDGSADGEEEGG